MIALKFRAFIKNELGGFMIPETDSDCFMVSNGNGFTVYDEYKNSLKDNQFIIMQYTGLNDLKLKEIYEGDILSKKWKAEVYKTFTGCFAVRFHTNPEVNKPQTLYDYLNKRQKAGTAEDDCVVIGNVYKNPKLCQ